MINIKKLTSYLATTSLLLTLALLASCSSGSDEPRMISAGESSRSFSNLSFGSVDRENNDDLVDDKPIHVELCHIAHGVGSLAIVEVATQPVLAQEENCEGPFGGVAVKIPLRAWAVAAGEPVPEFFSAVSFEYVSVALNRLSVGDMLLVNVFGCRSETDRCSGDAWWVEVDELCV